MTIISDDYDGDVEFFFSDHSDSVLMKSGVAFNYTGNRAAFVMDDISDTFTVGGYIQSSYYGIEIAGIGARINIAVGAVLYSYSFGIYVSSSAEQVVIDNYGSITGTVGIDCGSAIGRVSIRNYGVVSGNYSGSEAIYTGSGADTIDNFGIINGDIKTGAGIDRIDTHLGTVAGRIYGEAGDDTYIIAANQAVVETDGSAAGGYDTVMSYGDYTLTDFVEVLRLLGTATVGRGNALDNQIQGNDNGNLLFGAGGADTVLAGGGDDVLRGGAGDDILASLEGADRFFGGTGDDLVQVGLDTVRIDGGAGTDIALFLQNDTAIVVDLTLSTGVVKGGAAGLDTLISVEGIWGSEFADTLTGNAVANDFLGYLGDDIIKGAGGDDIIGGFDGLDQLDGGDGIDTLSFANDSNGVIVSLLTNMGTSGAAAGETYVGFENLRGGFGVDTLVGSAGANTLEGGAAADVLNAGSGIDTLYGDAGNDQLTGGAAKDLFCFRDIDTSSAAFTPGGFGKDTITDFQDGLDRISFVGDSQVHSLSDLTIVQSGSSTLVTVTGTTDQIVLLNFAPVNFTSADVIFG